MGLPLPDKDCSLSAGKRDCVELQIMVVLLSPDSTSTLSYTDSVNLVIGSPPSETGKCLGTGNVNSIMTIPVD